MRFIVTISLVITSLSFLYSQIGVSLNGLIVDQQTGRKLYETTVIISNDEAAIKQVITSDKDGAFYVELLPGKIYDITFTRPAYHDIYKTIEVSDTAPPALTIAMLRYPGYEFEGTVRQLVRKSANMTTLGEELKNLRIEVYNNTADKEITIIEDDPDNTFQAVFERGNHYSLLIRKKGYYAKRIDVFVDIEGCILCFEGLGNEYHPEIESATTETNDRGSIIADIPMKKIVKDEITRLDNIYYDFGKWDIRQDARPALNNLVNILKSNPIAIELSSHTDSRGADDYNMSLSEKRAKSAVDYIISRGIKSTRITSEGYGESMPLNECVDGTKCSEAEFQYNRRTEFKVTQILEKSNYTNKSLQEIITEEKKINKRIKESLDL